MLFALPSASFATALTQQQSASLIAVVQSSPGTLASAFVSLITAFSNITVTQAASLITVVQAAPGVPANAFINLLTSFTEDTTTMQSAAQITEQTDLIKRQNDLLTQQLEDQRAQTEAQKMQNDLFQNKLTKIEQNTRVEQYVPPLPPPVEKKLIVEGKRSQIGRGVGTPPIVYNSLLRSLNESNIYFVVNYTENGKRIENVPVTITLSSPDIEGYFSSYGNNPARGVSGNITVNLGMDIGFYQKDPLTLLKDVVFTVTVKDMTATTTVKAMNQITYGNWLAELVQLKEEARLYDIQYQKDCLLPASWTNTCHSL